MENTLYNISTILAENERRQAELADDRYDPLTGVGCWGDRVEAGGCLVPRTLLQRCPDYPSLELEAQERQRIVDDFEYWCARCVVIKDKVTSQNVPFVLNRPQRRLLAVMEEQRVAGRPVRVILLKARQWGGSTLVQMYMAWMQLVRHTGWNSLICGHKRSSSANIKRMYNLMLRNYPPELLDEDADQPRFAKLEGQPNVQQLDARDCLVIIGSALSEDAVRGYDIAMAHMSEVSHWKESAMHSPDDVVRSVSGSVALKPETVVVLESTAKGVGDYFHTEWLRAVQGQSDKAAVFVPWHEIAIYSSPVDDPVALWQAMDEYERTLWRDGCTLEQINWYHAKRLEYRTHELMMSEFPTNASEAFATSGHHPFSREHLDELATDCCKAPILVGDIMADGQEGYRAKSNIRLVPERNGLLQVWEQPVKDAPMRVDYMVVVDVGGRSESSDYSVIAVWRAAGWAGKAAIVAQWRGHIDHGPLAWKSMQLAKYYNNALLVVESNTLTNEAARVGQGDYILSNVQHEYGKIYQRGKGKLGFHTNVKTKQMAIAALTDALRLHSYEERDIEAVNEMRYYEEHNGHYAARNGKHDDILMTRAIGLLLLNNPKVFRPEGTQAPDKSLTRDGWIPAAI